MNDQELQQAKELFYSAINKLELEYSYYLCLHSIQKGLTVIESLNDHFDLDPEKMVLCFKAESDLPDALKAIIHRAHQQIFAGHGKV